MAERDRETGEKGGKVTPEEIIKTFEMVWALSEDKAKLALFGLIMMYQGDSKIIGKILTKKEGQDNKDS